jgi:probable F420-dependent oxidoreductase
MAVLSATRTLRVTTSVLVAFPRSPMTTAIAAWDLQSLSGGRFELGLGTQVRGNIVGRYSTTWDSPVSRMREYVESLRAIFHSFATGDALGYEGEHYAFTRLQPFFNPGPLECPSPPILLGAVGPDMTRMAGGTADGVMTHPTHSAPRVLIEQTLPLIAEGARRKNRDASDCAVLASGFVVTGSDAAALAAQRDWVRGHLAFLYSTPAYWASLDLLGFGDVGRALNVLSKQGRWDEMRGLVGDEMIDAIVPHGDYDDIARVLIDAYEPIVGRITFPVSEDPAYDERVADVLTIVRDG